MLKQEARWLGRELAAAPLEQVSPLLNIGSSTRYFREVQQPWIEQELFAPLRRRGGSVIHQDMKADEGVDVVGALTDPACRARLGALGVRSVCCTNVLEHVSERRAFASELMEWVAPGGLLVLSVPRAFPWHPDPIDTMYRPTVPELSQLFPGMQVMSSDIVRCGRLGSLVAQDVPGALRRLLQPGQGAGTEAPRASLVQWLWPWLVRPFEVTCAVLKRV
ncbi:class I SAM-dependent methyltransferase [Myxococcus eversor]|uniref:class I SAM-dependent methyltransferase n=1 Tax=Myxococcus eversor TaxID=2709661 RepID=UPI0013D0A3BF|nr:hypothetical protein [Myxococcus eversor]